MLKSSLLIISLFYTSIPCHVFGRFFVKLSSCTCAVLVSPGFLSRFHDLRWQPSDAHCSQLCRWTLKRSFLVFNATLCGPNLASQRRCFAFDDKQSRCHVSDGISPTSLCRCLGSTQTHVGHIGCPSALTCPTTCSPTASVSLLTWP